MEKLLFQELIGNSGYYKPSFDNHGFSEGQTSFLATILHPEWKLYSQNLIAYLPDEPIYISRDDQVIKDIKTGILATKFFWGG